MQDRRGKTGDAASTRPNKPYDESNRDGTTTDGLSAIWATRTIALSIGPHALSAGTQAGACQEHRVCCSSWPSF